MSRLSSDLVSLVKDLKAKSITELNTPFKFSYPIKHYGYDLKTQEFFDDTDFASLTKEEKAILCAILLSPAYFGDIYYFFSEHGAKDILINPYTYINKFVEDAESAKIMCTYLKVLSPSVLINNNYESCQEFLNFFNHNYPLEDKNWIHDICKIMYQNQNEHFLILRLEWWISEACGAGNQEAVDNNLLLTLKKLCDLINNQETIEKKLLRRVLQQYNEVFPHRRMANLLLQPPIYSDSARREIEQFNKESEELSKKIAQLQYEYLESCWRTRPIILHWNDLNIILGIHLLLLVVSIALYCMSLVPVIIPGLVGVLSATGCRNIFFYKKEHEPKMLLKKQCAEEYEAFSTQTSAYFSQKLGTN
jgi:hypothetical protein